MAQEKGGGRIHEVWLLWVATWLLPSTQTLGGNRHFSGPRQPAVLSMKIIRQAEMVAKACRLACAILYASTPGFYWTFKFNLCFFISGNIIDIVPWCLGLRLVCFSQLWLGPFCRKSLHKVFLRSVSVEKSVISRVRIRWLCVQMIVDFVCEGGYFCIWIICCFHQHCYPLVCCVGESIMLADHANTCPVGMRVICANYEMSWASDCRA